MVVTVDPAKVDEFKKAMENHPYEELGFVTQGSIQLDGMDWGSVASWQTRYDTAIENLLAGHESEHALSAL